MSRNQSLITQIGIVKDFKRKMNQIQEVESVLPEEMKLYDFSDASIEVMESFSLEAPAILNHYACALEDVLLTQVKLISDLRAENLQLKEQLQQCD